MKWLSNILNGNNKSPPRSSGKGGGSSKEGEPPSTPVNGHSHTINNNINSPKTTTTKKEDDNEKEEPLPNSSIASSVTLDTTGTPSVLLIPSSFEQQQREKKRRQRRVSIQIHDENDDQEEDDDDDDENDDDDASDEAAPTTRRRRRESPPSNNNNNNSARTIDLEREKTRLESFESYVLVSILTASASFSVLETTDRTTVPFLTEGDATATAVAGDVPPRDWIQTCTVLAAGLSAICGLHATIVFSLCVLYGKTALGLQRDESYLEFLKQVAPARIRGFNTFSASLLLFAVECALLLYSHMSDHFKWLALLTAFFSMYFIFDDWYQIIQAAKQIFNVTRPSMSTMISKRTLQKMKLKDDDEEEQDDDDSDNEEEDVRRRTTHHLHQD